MHCDYSDIRDLIQQAPLWFDERAVPRYAQFEPGRAANIYCDECALVEITCQGCGKAFQVAFSSDVMRRIATFPDGTVKERPTLAEHIGGKTLHYGDPPNIGCCAAGPTMNSEPQRVLEYWRRHHQQYVKDGRVQDVVAYMEWRRDPELEISISTFEEEEA